jgi:signal transduction histidine kinase
MKRWPGWSARTIDAVIAAAVGAIVQQNVWFWEGADETFADRQFSSPIMLLATASLFWRRRAPLAVAAAVASALLAQTAASGTFTQTPGTALLAGVALYSLGAHTSVHQAAAGAVLVGAAIQLKGVIAAPTQSDESPFVFLFWWLLVLSTVGLGTLVRSRRRAARLQASAASLEAERAAHAREAVAEERRRIARELHDVVSHNVSASILQAEAAEELLKTDPDRAGAALQSIQGMGREALGEMRRMLGIIRADNGGAPSEPQPRLSDLPALIERTRDSGLVAELRTEGTPFELAPGIELSAYRIVQEALTNVRKHAGHAHVSVCVEYREGSLGVRIGDDGRGGAAADHGSGHGLIGMRERVEFFGGDFTAGPGAAGGFEVRAVFPLATVTR